MVIISWILIVCILVWSATRYDKKMNENFINFAVRADFLENRVQSLEILNKENEDSILEHKKMIRELSDRIFELEKPYQKSMFDD